MVLSVHNLSKRYGELLAVDGVSFAVGRGEIVGLLGSHRGTIGAVRLALTAPAATAPAPSS